MKRIFIALLILFSGIISQAQKINVLVVTGGHAFDTLQFFQMFDALDGINYKHLIQPLANKELVKGVANESDVLVFYDMWKTISEDEKSAYINLTKEGKPFLFLHHSLASYQNWPEFEKIIGGKYVEKGKGKTKDQESTYEHDVWVNSTVENDHPVTSGFNSIKLFDEVYGNFRVLESVIPLLKTSHPQSSPVIAWENTYNASKIVYLQPGHDYHAFESPDYRKLLLQAINYLSKSK